MPAEFVFSVRCNQDLTHRIGLKPTDEAFEVFYKMKAYCRVLESPFLVLDTSVSQSLDGQSIRAARDFFSSVSMDGVRLVWEYRAPFTPQINSLTQDFGIVQSVDLSQAKPSFSSNLVYSRLFGKGKHIIYQFTDDELAEIERRADKTEAKTVVLAFHGLRMNTDAIRFRGHRITGKYLPVTSYVGVDSAKAVLAEDAAFPSSKQELIVEQGWKVIDLTANKRVHLAADFAYFRWHGRGEKIWFDYPYSKEELELWVPKVQDAASKVKKVYGYFNNHYHGYAPENCLQLLERLGLLSQEQKKAKDKGKVKQSQLGAFLT